MNVTEGLEKISEDKIKVGKEEAGTSDFNQVYYKLKAKQDKAQIRNLLEMVQRKFHGHITQ